MLPIRRCLLVAALAVSWTTYAVRAEDSAAATPGATAADLLADPTATPESLHAAGDKAASARDWAQARKCFLRASELGHAPSMVRAGDLLNGTLGGPRQPERARPLYLAAAERGELRAMERFAVFAARGWGGPQDTEAALKWATQAFDQGHLMALEILGAIYEEGLGVPRDLAKALEWYDRGAALNHHNSSSAAARLRRAAATTPEQKLADFEATLTRIKPGPRAARDRGRAFANFHRALFDSGLSVQEAAAAARPGLETLIETDFHAVADALSATPMHLKASFEAQLTAEQRQVIRQVYDYRAAKPGVTPKVGAGQGWSTVFPKGTAPTVAQTPTAPRAPAPTTAAPAAPARPAAQPATATRATDELSEFTRDATTWEEFFTASALRAETFHVRHSSDVGLFLKKHPATSEQLRTAYRAARSAFKPTPGTDLGKERGSMFVAYTLALEATGMSTAAVVSFARADFQALAQTDSHGATQALMGVKDPIDPWRAALNPTQNARVREIAAIISNRQPFPKVPEPRAQAPAVAATTPPARPSAPAAPGEDPSARAHALYTELVASFRRSPGQPRDPLPSAEQNTRFEQLAALIPKAAEYHAKRLDERWTQQARRAPGLADLQAAINAAAAKNYREAVRLWEKAIAQGSHQAMATLAAHLDEGIPEVLPADPERALALRRRAVELGNEYVLERLINTLVVQPAASRDDTWLADLMQRANAAAIPQAGYAGYYYHSLLRREAQNRGELLVDRTALAAANARLAEAVRHLTAAALHGSSAAALELGLYHFHGGIPGIRNSSRHGHEHLNLPLARFWTEYALRDKNLAENNAGRARDRLAAIDRAYALRKGRPWKPDDLLAALKEDHPHTALAYLISSEGAELYDADLTRIETALPPGALPEYGVLSMSLMPFLRSGGGDAVIEATDARIERHLAAHRPEPRPALADSPELRARFAAGDPVAAYELFQVLNALHPHTWPETEPEYADVLAQALTGDDPRTQWLRVFHERLATHPDPAKRDPVRAAALLRAAAEAGEAEAARQLAELYVALGNERGVRRNYHEAEHWYLHALVHARPDQRWSIGDLSPRSALYALYSAKRPSTGGGITMSENHPATAPWLAELRRRGAPFSEQVDLYFAETSSAARRARLKPEMEKLATLPAPYTEVELADLRRRAEAGEVSALLELGQALAHGLRGLRQRDDLAHALHRRAAEAGSPEGMRVLADELQHGYGVRQDLVAAVQWRARANGREIARADVLVAAARLAADHNDTYPLLEPYLLEAISLGSAEAKRLLASYLMQGRVVKKDAARAMQLYTEAAEAGSDEAMSSLAYHYGEGKEVPKDVAASFHWRVRAAEAGNRLAIAGLAFDYDRGTDGAPVDKQQALRWARLAAEHDNQIRTGLLARLERELAAATPAAPATPAEPGADAFARAGSLEGDARLAALRVAAQAGHAAATLRLIDALVAAKRWHEAHWWTLRPAVIEHEESTAARASIERERAFAVLGLKSSRSEFGGGAVIEEFSAERDEPLEKAMPELEELLVRAGADRTRLLEQLDRLIDRSAGRAEPLIAKAQLVIDQEPGPARDLLERAVALQPLHPQAQVLLARLEVKSGEPHRAHYRLHEVARARPNSLQVARAQADLLVALGGSPRECADLRGRLHHVLKHESSDTARFGGLMSSLKLAEAARDRVAYLADLNAAIEIQPAPQFVLQRAQLSEQNKDYPRALADYQHLLDGPAGKNPQQAAQLRQRIEAVNKAMETGTARLSTGTASMEAGLERVREANTDEAKQRMGDRVGAAMDFVAGNRAHEAGDIEKARELWSKAAAAGHEEAAERLAQLP